MNLDTPALEAAIKAKVVAIAEQLGDDASDLAHDEIIPASGYIDSAGLLELVAWFEAAYQLRVPAEELTIDNLGTIQSMAAYARRKHGLG